ncbi:MAG: NADH-quinone oxidoreductase subunit NuoE family protein [Candidatus Limnocylindrales bacterium]
MSPTRTEDDVAVIARRWKTKRGSLIMALHGLQDRYGYVPRDAAMNLGEQMDVPLARIYEVLTFYNYFRLEAPGKHVVSVCMGTACYLKGAPQLLDDASRRLGIGPGETTSDGEYHLQVVRCVGCCGLAPVVTVNGTLLAKVTGDSLEAAMAPAGVAAPSGMATPIRVTKGERT